jgi:hypothetical protein
VCPTEKAKLLLKSDIFQYMNAALAATLHVLESISFNILLRRAQRPPKHHIETPPPMILQVARTMTAGTGAHSFAVPLKLFVDHNVL